MLHLGIVEPVLREGVASSKPEFPLEPQGLDSQSLVAPPAAYGVQLIPDDLQKVQVLRARPGKQLVR